MPNCKEVIFDHTQKKITSFFPEHKGPLKIECNKIITSVENHILAQKYKKRRMKKNISKITNIDDNDCIKVEYDSETNCTGNGKRPISPTIILRTDIGYTKYLNSDESISSDKYESVIYETSPTKRQKYKAELAVTKSEVQAKSIDKISRTFQMTQSSISDFTESVSNITEGTKKPIEPIDDIEDILKIEIVENNETLQKINNHITLIEQIIDNATTNSLSKLLFERDKIILRNYQTLTTHQKYFSCKLFTHQVKWYNASKFAENIHLPISQTEVDQIIKTLKEKSIIGADYTSEKTVSLLKLLSSPDVKEIHNKLRLKTKQKDKLTLINAILEYANKQTTVNPTMSLDKRIRDMVSKKLGVMIHIKPEFYTAFYKSHLLYTYTNPEFAIPSGLYLRMNAIKYGDMRYPNYICKDEMIFEDANEFDEFYKARSYKDEIIQVLDKKGASKFATLYDMSKEIVKEFANILGKVGTSDPNIKSKYLNRFTAGHQYASALSILAKHLGAKYPSETKEWLNMLLDQIHFYEKKRGLWYTQLSVIYNTHLKDSAKAIKTLIDGLKDEKVSFVNISEIVYRGRSFSKKKNVKLDDLSSELSVWKEKIPDSQEFPCIGIKALANDSSEAARKGDYKYMDKNGDITYMNVEEIAIKHYIDEKGFTQGIHCEGSLIHAVFYMIFWDIIYSNEVPYTFVCNMQYIPLDFNTPDFYNNRKTDIDQRLQNFKYDWTSEYLKNHVIQTFHLASDSVVVIPNFIQDGEKLYSVINCIGRVALGNICQRLLQNFGDYRAGMPDLFMYSENKCKFVEVKGPGDKLSSKQKLWINFMLSVGLDAEVCHVSKIGSSRRNKT